MTYGPWTQLTSTNLQEIRYDADAQLLQVHFHANHGGAPGPIYTYSGVDHNVAGGLFRAASPGRYLAHAIIPFYPSDPPPQPHHGHGHHHPPVHHHHHPHPKPPPKK